MIGVAVSCRDKCQVFPFLALRWGVQTGHPRLLGLGFIYDPLSGTSPGLYTHNMILEGKIYCAALLYWKCEFVNKKPLCMWSRPLLCGQVSFILAAAMELAAALGQALLV